MDRIRSKWNLLLQVRPDIRALMEVTKLIGGEIRHNASGEVIFEFFTRKGIFCYNETTHEFKRKLEIR